MRIGLLVTTGPFQSQNWETAASIAEAAIVRGHEVAFFFSVDGVYIPVRPRSNPGSTRLPHQRIESLLERGAHALVCGTAAEMRGLGRSDYHEGIVVGGLPDFAMQFGEVDRLISL
jgi:tRNA 2-thiouridine synthesizing protein D